MNNFKKINQFSDPESTFGTTVHDFLLAQAKEQFEERRKVTEAALQSHDGVIKYQEQLRERYKELTGTLGTRTPLDSVMTGIVKADGYRIEKVAYESRPRHYVTANLYIPTRGDGPWPGVLVLCGHAWDGKAAEKYQKACILLAMNGFVALIADPVCQGERLQILDKNGKPAKKGEQYVYATTFEHSLIDYGSRLVGRSTVAYELWDNIRSIDYLLSRDEVDSNKPVGCTGNSGGGTQTTFLMAWDERIGPAAPSCYMSTLEWVFKNRLFDDGCQHLAGEGKAGFERADYMIMRAPKPTLVLAATRDGSFSISSTREAFADAMRFYDVLDCRERLAMFEGEHGHGFEKPLRQEAVRWMRRWLYADNSPVVEPELTVQKEEDIQVTRTGQSGSNWKDALLVPQLNLLLANELLQKRKRFCGERISRERQARIKQLLGLKDNDNDPVMKKMGVIDGKGYHIERIKIIRKKELALPGLLFVPDSIAGSRPAVLYVNGQGKTADMEPGGAIESLLKQGYIVLAIDMRGTGESKNTIDYRYTSYMYDEDYVNLMLSMHLGRPMLGQRVGEVLASVEVLAGKEQVDATNISVTGIGLAGPVVLHAAVFDDRISSVMIKNSIVSWLDIVRAPLADGILSHVVPGALEYYDLADLVSFIAPRQVKIVDPVKP